MTRWDYIWQWASYTIALLAVAFLNFLVLTRLPLGAVPILVPTVAFAVGVLEGPVPGAGFGIVVGVVYSALTRGSALWVIVLPLLGLAIGLLAKYVIRRGLVAFLLSVLVTAVLYDAGQVVIRLVRGVAELEPLMQVAVPECFWTVVFSILAFWLCHICCRYFGRIHHEQQERF